MSSHGWIAEEYDANVRPYRSRLSYAYTKSVDLFKDHPEWLKVVYDQARSQSCVANATAATYRCLAYCTNHEGPDKSSITVNPARLFLYYNARLLPKLDKAQVAQGLSTSSDPPIVSDHGSENRDYFKGLNLYGVCDEVYWPCVLVEATKRVVDVNRTPKPEAYTQAKLSHAVEYCRLDPDHPAGTEAGMSEAEKRAVGTVTLMQLKQCLSERYPVVFASDIGGTRRTSHGIRMKKCGNLLLSLKHLNMWDLPNWRMATTSIQVTLSWLL